jgi:formylmethanofuran dehydrogenase subunit E
VSFRLQRLVGTRVYLRTGKIRTLTVNGVGKHTITLARPRRKGHYRVHLTVGKTVVTHLFRIK